MSRERINFEISELTARNVAAEIRHIHRAITALEGVSSPAVAQTKIGNANIRSGNTNISSGSNTVTFTSQLSTSTYTLTVRAKDSDGAEIQLNDVSRNQYGFTVLASYAGTLEYVAVEIV